MGSIPDWMPASATTDIVQLLLGIKPAVRIHIDNRRIELRRWARRLGLFASVDADGYAAVSRSPYTARRVINLDRRPGRHTLALGIMLGYPLCCSRAAARVGDEGIDCRQRKVSAQRFHGRFNKINPSGYSFGISMVSHVPCSNRCVFSLRLAMRMETC
jgi:hypothetical protein